MATHHPLPKSRSSRDHTHRHTYIRLGVHPQNHTTLPTTPSSTLKVHDDRRLLHESVISPNSTQNPHTFPTSLPSSHSPHPSTSPTEKALPPLRRRGNPHSYRVPPPTGGLGGPPPLPLGAQGVAGTGTPGRGRGRTRGRGKGAGGSTFRFPSGKRYRALWGRAYPLWGMA